MGGGKYKSKKLLTWLWLDFGRDQLSSGEVFSFFGWEWYQNVSRFLGEALSASLECAMPAVSATQCAAQVQYRSQHLFCDCD